MNIKNIIKRIVLCIPVYFMLLCMALPQNVKAEKYTYFRDYEGEWKDNGNDDPYMVYKYYKGIKYTRSNEGVVIKGYKGNKKELTIPEKIGGLEVIEISSLYPAKKLQTLHLPKTIRRGGKYI